MSGGRSDLPVSEWRTDLETGGIWSFYDNFEAFPFAADERGNRDDRIVAQVQMGLDAVDGGTHGEWAVRWFRFDRFKDEASPRLEVFSDAWAVLARSGLLEVLAEFDKSTDRSSWARPDDFMARLRSLGWRDRTESLKGRSHCPTCGNEGWEGRYEVIAWRRRVAAERPNPSGEQTGGDR